MFCGRGAEAPTGSWYKVEELSNVKVVKSKKEKMFVSNKDKYNFFFLFFSSSGMCLFDEVSSAVRCAGAAGDQVKQPFVRAADKWLQSVKKKKGLFWTSSAASDRCCLSARSLPSARNIRRRIRRGDL